MKRLLKSEHKKHDFGQTDEKPYTLLHEKAQSGFKFIPLGILKILTSDLWRIIILFSIFLNYVVTSFSYFFLSRGLHKKTYYFVVILDVIYAVNYIVALTIFFWKRSQLHLNKQPRSKVSLTIDFLLVFPYSYIYEAIVQESYDSNTFLCLHAILALRLFHILIYFKEISDVAGGSHFKNFILQYLTFLIILQQATACIWYFMAFPKYSTTPSTEWTKVDEMRGRYTDPVSHYIISVYYALLNITGRNFGDIVPLDTGGKIFIIMVVFAGFTLTTGIFIGSLSFLCERAYKIRAELRNQVQNIEKYLDSISMNDKGKTVIRNYYKILWTKKDGIHESDELAQLPFPLKSEICVDINIRPLQRSIIFRDKPEAFLRSVSYLMKHEFYQPGQLIYHSSVVKDKMIFVVLGTIEILSDEDDESQIIAFDAGTCLGESSLVLSLPSRCSVRTVCYTELQVLYRRDFYSIIDSFPQLYADIRKTIMERIEHMQQISLHKRRSTVRLVSTLLQFEKGSIIKSLKDKLRKLIPKDPDEDKHLSLYRLNDGDVDVDRQTIFLSEKFPWFLRENSSLHLCWEGFIIFIAIFISIFYPYYIIFKKEYPHWFIRSFLYTDFFLMLDVFVILCTAIEEKNTTTRTVMGILRKRLRQPGFYLDFLSCLWIEKFYVVFTDNEHFEHILQLNRMLKVYRVPKRIQILENHINIQIFGIRIMKYILYLLFSAYFIGALYYMITCFEYICTEDGWFFTKVMEDLKAHIKSSYSTEETLMSVYYSLSFISSLTYIDILPNNLTDMILACFATLFGIFLVSFCIAELSATITWRLKIITKFQESLFALINYMREKNIEKELELRIENFFVLQWNYDEGVGLREQSLFFNANTNIQTMVKIKEKMEIIESVPLFRGKNLDFIHHLVTSATNLVLPPNEFITYKGEIVEILYIIQEGYCIRHLRNKSIILGPKSIFGSINFFTSVNALTTIKTLTHVKILCITHKMLWKSASMFPIVAKQFQKVVTDSSIKTDIEQLPHGESITTEEGSHLQGSIVNMISYCKQHKETYGEPFKELRYLQWIKIIFLPICILPYGFFLKIWVTMRLVVAFIAAILIPYDLIQTSHEHNLDEVIFATDIVAYIDLYVMMYVGYYGPKNQLIMHPLKTAAHYIKSKFLIDLILCFPWEVFAFYLTETSEKRKDEAERMHDSWLRIIRVLQIYRLPQFFNYFSEDIRIKGNIVEILKLIPIAIIVINLFATLVVKSSCEYYSKNDLSPSDIYNESFVQPQGMAHHQLQDYIMFCQKHSWIDKSQFRNYTRPYEVYTAAMYFSTSILTSTPIGDVTPQYSKGLILTIAMIICGTLFFGYVYASISSHKADWNSLLSKNQEMVNELKKFMEQEKVRKELQQQIIDGLEYRWKRSKGTEPNEILVNLHPLLHEDAVLTVYESTLIKVPIFENADRSFFRVIGKLVKEMYYLRQEYIYKANDIVTDICIVYRGKVKITSKVDESETLMGSGGIFGNITPHNKNKISVTITALSNVDILCMESQVFYDVLQKYPSIKETIDNTSTDVDFIESKFRETYEAEQPAFTSSSRQELNSVIGCFLICLPWKLFRVAISPHSLIYTFIDFFCLILAYTNSIFVIYEFAFQHYSLSLLCVAIVTDVTFLTKLVIDMHKSYEDQYGELVMSNKKIIKRYFETHTVRRCVYCFSSLPFYYLAFVLSLFPKLNYHLLFSSLRLVTIFRFLDVLEYYDKKSNQLLTNKLLLKIGISTALCTLVIHTFACGWYLCACPLGFCFKESWITTQLPLTGVESKINIYVTCFYFMVGLCTSSSNGDVVPQNLREQIYITVVMFITNFLIGIFIGDIMNTLNSLTIARVNYEYGINELQIYLRNCNVSEFQMEKMWRYVQQLWTISNGQQMPRLLPLLHPVSRYELMWEIYGHHLKRSHIFSDVEESFASQLTRYFKRTIFFPGNYIVKHGDSDKSMYFIHYGEVEILTVLPNLTETVHDVLQAGEMFGTTQGLFHGVSHHFSFRASTTVHTVSLCLSDWEYLLNFFPETKESIYDKANNIYT